MKGRSLWFQAFRKLTQTSMLLFVVWVAVSMHWRNFKVAHNNKRIVGLLRGELVGELYGWIERFLTLLGDPLAVSESMLGGPWGMSVGGVPIVDPYAVAAVTASGHLPTWSMLLGALVPIALAVVLGKVFCSFLCPARLMFEVAGAVRRGFTWLGVPLPSVPLPRIGLWVGLGSVLFAASAGPAIFHFVLPYYAISSGILVGMMAGAVSTTVVWAAVLVLVDLFIAPGQICRSLCPTGALLEQLGRFSLLSVVRSEEACPPSCDACQRVCPYGLYPGRRSHNPGCDACGRCVMTCPSQRLGHRLGRPAAGLARVGKIAAIALGAAAFLGAFLFASTARAHHNKGLPHYGYFENYPQVPTEEFIDEVGRWEVGVVLFNFQGLQRKTSDTPDDVRIFAYAYDLQDGRGYHGPLTLHIEREGVRIATYDRLEPDQEGVYVTRHTMPASGTYTMVFELENGDQPGLEFEADLGADRVNWSILGGAGAILGGVFLLALVGRRKRLSASAAPAAAG